MKEGATALPLYRSGATVRAARIAVVDHALAQLTIQLPDGKREMRHGKPEMFAGPRLPRCGDWLVETEHGHRCVLSHELFRQVYAPVLTMEALLRDPGLMQEQHAMPGSAVVIREASDAR